MRISPRQYSDHRDLVQIDERLALLPDAVDLRFARACCLEDLGWIEDASRGYLATLERDARHLGALTNLGLMFLERDDFATARAFLTQALTHHPLHAIVHVNLARALFEQGEHDSALAHYEAALRLDPDDFPALHGLALAYEATGAEARARTYFERAFATRSSWTIPYTGPEPRVRVLLLVSARGGDVITHLYLDAALVETTMLVPEGVRAQTPLPAHDVVFNAIGDAERCRPALERTCDVLSRTTARVINAPERVLQTARAVLATQAGAIPGVIFPRTEWFRRDELSADALTARGWTFPLLVRAPGYQAGRHFERIDDATALADAVQRLPGNNILVIAFVDTRSADGFVRKYRVLFIDGALYPAHLAISSQWKVHYFSSTMAVRADHRAEERAFLENMEAVLGQRALDALRTLEQAIGLDYGGVDCSIDSGGNVVVFEANAMMAVYPPPVGEEWSYRRPAFETIVRAVRTLVLRGSLACDAGTPVAASSH